MTDEERPTDDSGADQPEATEQENEQATTERGREEDDMRGPAPEEAA